jgi:flagellin-like protein
MNKTLKKIKAVSPIVATIILIIITIIAGIVIYFYVTGFLAGGATNVSLKISGGATAPGGGTQVFVTLTIKNDGNVPVRVVFVRVESAAVGLTDFVGVATPLLNLDPPIGNPPAFPVTGFPTLSAGQSITVQYRYSMTQPVAGFSTIIRVIGVNTVTGQTVGFTVTLAITPG